MEIKPRREVTTFALKMESKLQENDHKGGWERETFEYLLSRLKDEVQELETAFSLHSTLPYQQMRNVANETLDIGNFAMMIHDKASTELARLHRW